MNTNKTRDDIDLELSRTYFRGGSQSGKPAHNVEPPKKNSTVKIFLITAFILLLIVSGITYLLMRNQVHFTVNVNLGEGSTSSPIAADESTLILYNFEKDDESWEIPSWAKEKNDYVATDLTWSKERSSSGVGSIVFKTDYPPRKWSGALVEIQQYLDLTGHDKILVDVYLPPEAVTGLKGKIILTVGDDWRFIEMSRSKKLSPGKWNTIEASIADGSRDWKRTVTDDAFRSDIRKISVRVESDKNPAWRGNIHVDNVRTTKVEPQVTDQPEK